MSKWRFSRKKHSSHPELPGLFLPPKKHRLATPKEQSLVLAKSRLGLVFLLFALAWTVIAGRIGYLTMNSGDGKRAVAVSSHKNPTSRRADIVDRNGVILATSLPTMSLCADSRSIIDAKEAAKKLMKVLPELNPQKLEKDLLGGKHCAMIRRHLTPKQYNDVNMLGIAGLEFRPDERRIYPSGNLTSHVVGFSDIDERGIAGIEKSMDERLEEQRDPVALSLDIRIQNIMRQELHSAMSEYSAEAAAGIVLDIATGEIISMVSLPDFDPNQPGNSSEEQRFNRNTLGVYEMGSTFKIFNTALALDSGLVHLGDTFDTLNPISIGRYAIKDFEKSDHNLNVTEIFAHSSNIGSARMAQRVGGMRQRAFFTKLGLAEKISLELPEVGTPLLPSAKNWSEATTLTAAFGHGVAVNAVQMIGAVATIANDGKPVRPTVIKATEPQEEIYDPIISPKTSAVIKALMRLVVTRGTAKKADVEGYMVGGKTGTADKLSSRNKYEGNGRRASFIGLFPINAPRYLVYAMLDNPKANAKTMGFATAGWVVAPSIKSIVTQAAPLLGMPPMPEEIMESVEAKVMKPLGSETVDGIPVSELPHYAEAKDKNRER